ncbi:hypothetical protein Hanom_Chr11g01024791 [Helianthus anomalus]
MCNHHTTTTLLLPLSRTPTRPLSSSRFFSDEDTSRTGVTSEPPATFSLSSHTRQPLSTLAHLSTL